MATIGRHAMSPLRRRVELRSSARVTNASSGSACRGSSISPRSTSPISQWASRRAIAPDWSAGSN
eukprot:scaffold101414_cov28-Tisochrysis_lutea.AAC.3